MMLKFPIWETGEGSNGRWEEAREAGEVRAGGAVGGPAAIFIYMESAMQGGFELTRSA